MNCGHSSDLIVYWGNEPFCLMCEHQELKEKLADAEAQRERGKAHAQERIGLVLDVAELERKLAAANTDIDRLNQMLRATGYGQGQIDSYAAECEARELAEEAARWLYGICTGKLKWVDVRGDDHPAKRWPFLAEEVKGARDGT